MKRYCSSCGHEYPGDKNFCERDGSRLVFREGLTGGVVGGRYRLEGLIGSGGYGDVYVATVQDALPEAGLAAGSTAALKLITRRGRPAAEWDNLKRLQKRETAVASRIRHPNLLPIHDSGEDQAAECLYIAMPLGGRDLKTILADEGPLAPDYSPERWHQRAISMALQVCDALAALHANNIYHRDVKPQNVMEFAGRVMLIDYGIAKDPAAASYASGTIRGTVDYMAPEYFRDEAGDLDYAMVDQYSLGVMLFEVFSGEQPFKIRQGLNELAYQQAMLKKHLEEAPPPLRSRRPEAPEGIEAAVARMLEKSPKARFQGMAAVRAALAAARPSGTRGRTDAAPLIELSGVQVQVDPGTGKTRYTLRF